MTSLPKDVQPLGWAADYLGISRSTAYREAEAERLWGTFKVGNQWRVFVPTFMRGVEQAASGSQSVDILSSNS